VSNGCKNCYAEVMARRLQAMGEVDLTNIHWVIVGGESGVKARPMDEDWVLNIKKQCVKQKAAFFFKQCGSWGSDGVKRNKKSNGRKLAGKVYDEHPEIEFSGG
ncbi:MAG: phage Gp37/Gp68 family protein, partial [Candidatus Delongbacteria bacterium]|nr:phage Gp37/Gp68 family protein [Candidatus Delongbacteria bacterium]